MDSTNNNISNQLFLCEFKELRNELSAMKKRIVKLEVSHEKQQERLNTLERENHALKTQLNPQVVSNLLQRIFKSWPLAGGWLNLNGDKKAGSTLKRKRTDLDQDNEEETESKPPVSVSVSTGKKTKTNNNDEDEAVVIPQYDNGDSFDSLSDDLLHKIVEFDGNCYSKFGLINKRCKNIYDVKEYKLKKVTCLYGYGTVDMMLQRYLQKRRDGTLGYDLRCNIAAAVVWYNRLDAIDWIIQLGDNELLHYLCGFAAWCGRTKALRKVFCNCNLTTLDGILNDDDLCLNAAYYGHLETLKLLRKYGAVWTADTFDSANDRSNDEILQYLRDEGCPETHEE